MPLPPPEVGEKNKFGETWDGSRWTGGASSVPMISLPPKAPSGRTDQQDAELLKQFLTMGGATVGSLGGPPGAILGGAIGRTLGHIPEALTSAATGRPNTGSFLNDPVLGAMEGAAAEVGSRVAGPALRVVGRGARALGEGLETLTGGRVASPLIRGLIGHEAGGWPAAVAAEVAPPALQYGGAGLERTGEALGSAPLGSRIRSGAESIVNLAKNAAGTFEAVPAETTISDQIEHARQLMARGYTRDAAAAAAGLPKSSAVSISAGTQVPSLAALSRKIEVDPATLEALPGYAPEAWTRYQRPPH